MFVAIVNDGAIADTGKLKDLFPNTSFPKSGPNDEWMTENNVQLVINTKSYDSATQKLNTVAAYIEDGVVYDVEVVDLTAEEITAKTTAATASKEKAVRARRDALLKETDFYALSDVTMSAEMEAYRQALRDITDHANFPDLVEESMDGTVAGDWPVKP